MAEGGVHSGPLLVIRFFQLFFSLAALGAIADTKAVFYRAHPAFQFLLGASIIAFIYCALLFLFSLVKICMSDKKFSGGLGWLQVVMDGFVGLIMLSAASAAAGLSTQYRKDKVCTGTDWAKWKTSQTCIKAEASIAMAFLAAFIILCTHWWFIHSTHRRL